MINSRKKGFTLVELVIVIAVIAILAAVLIPTFSSLIKKANVSNDTALVKNLNTALAADTDGQETMYEALQAANEFGYDIAKIQAKANGNKILWDSKNDCFVYLDSEKGLVYIPDSKKEQAADIDLWIISNIVNDKYSTYLYGENVPTEITTTKGIDTGEFIVDITYNGSEEATIRTNNGNLCVESGTVNHYGNAFFLTLNNGANYNEYGTIVANTADVPEIPSSESNEYVSVSTSEELKAALLNGGKIKLTANITENTENLDQAFIFKVTKDTTINLNGFNITSVRNTNQTSESNGLFEVSFATLTLNGYGVISLTHTGSNMGWSDFSSTISVQRGNVIINDAVVVEHLGGTDMAYAIDVLTNTGPENASLTINGGLVQSANYRAIRAFCNSTTGSVNITINGGIVRSHKNNTIWIQDSNASVNKATLTITGGLIEATNTSKPIYVYLNGDFNYTELITGGTFKSNGAIVSGNDIYRR